VQLSLLSALQLTYLQLIHDEITAARPLQQLASNLDAPDHIWHMSEKNVVMPAPQKQIRLATVDNALSRAPRPRRLPRSRAFVELHALNHFFEVLRPCQDEARSNP
jgi:hypothetical protein